MEKFTLINVEIDGKKVLAKVSLEELIDRAIATDLVWDNIDSALRDCFDEDLENECFKRGILEEIEDELEEEYKDFILPIYIEMACGRDPKQYLNKLFRKFLNREI